MKLTGKLAPNQILIKLRIQNDTIANGKLWIDRVFAEMEHTDIIGDVIQLPDRMFIRDPDMNIIERPIELMVGDTVYMFYLGIQEALKQQRREHIVYNPEGRVIRDGDDTYIILKHRDVFVALRGDKVIPVNDYVLIEPTYKELKDIEKKEKETGVLMTELHKQHFKNNTQWGIIRYVGQNLSQSDTGYSDEDLKPGKEVYMRKFADIPLEYELHRTFEPERKLCRVLRRDILYISE